MTTKKNPATRAYVASYDRVYYSKTQALAWEPETNPHAFATNSKNT
jgi:hypothetical protein